MSNLLDLSTALFLRVNDFARTSTWLHAPAVAYAKYGLVVFAALILVGVWRRRGDSDRLLAAAIWAGLGTLLAVAVNQPVAPRWPRSGRMPRTRRRSCSSTGPRTGPAPPTTR